MKKQQCIRRSATCCAQRVDTQVDWPNSFWDMTICLKPDFCKLKKQRCFRRSATCWTQRVHTQVDWPNSFWDMTKCLKSDFFKLKRQQCIRRSATCWAQCVDTQVDWPNSFWDMTKCLNLIFANWRNNCAEYTVVSSIWKNQILNILSYLRNYWANRPECERVVFSR